MPTSRRNNPSPSLTFLRISTSRADRVFHSFTNGVNTSESPNSNATAAPATIINNCCRFLICMCASLDPTEVECELHRRLALQAVDLEIGHVAGRAQFFQRAQQ